VTKDEFEAMSKNNQNEKSTSEQGLLDKLFRVMTCSTSVKVKGQ
jgi:hypothetical protein